MLFVLIFGQIAFVWTPPRRLRAPLHLVQCVSRTAKVEDRNTWKAAVCVFSQREKSTSRFIQYNTAGPKNPPSTPHFTSNGENTLKMHFYEGKHEQLGQINYNILFVQRLKEASRTHTLHRPRMQMLALRSLCSPGPNAPRLFSRTMRGCRE